MCSTALAFPRVNRGGWVAAGRGRPGGCRTREGAVKTFRSWWCWAGLGACCCCRVVEWSIGVPLETMRAEPSWPPRTKRSCTWAVVRRVKPLRKFSLAFGTHLDPRQGTSRLEMGREGKGSLACVVWSERETKTGDDLRANRRVLNYHTHTSPEHTHLRACMHPPRTSRRWRIPR